MNSKTKALKKVGSEELNAWGQDAKTAKGERKRLRHERSMKTFRKGAEARWKAGY